MAYYTLIYIYVYIYILLSVNFKTINKKIQPNNSIIGYPLFRKGKTRGYFGFEINLL